MRVLIGYDGSPCAEAAINDLRRAGLPPTGEMLVVTAADLYEAAIKTPDEPRTMWEMATEMLFAKAVSYARVRSDKLRLKAHKLARLGSSQMRAVFPKWTVRDKAVVGEAADAILSEAKRWKPDLIVVGSNGRSLVGRFFLGSVSQELAERAKVPVRIGRRDADKDLSKPIRIIAGSNNLDDNETLIRVLEKRIWPPDTSIHLVVVDDGVSLGRLSSEYAYSKFILSQSAEPLTDHGISVSVDIKKGEFRDVLFSEAETRNADAIFLNLGPMEKDDPNASASLITKTQCSVEIVSRNS